MSQLQRAIRIASLTGTLLFVVSVLIQAQTARLDSTSIGESCDSWRK